jgi:hypothetical protein
LGNIQINLNYYIKIIIINLKNKYLEKMYEI